MASIKLNTLQRAQSMLLQEVKDLENQIEVETKMVYQEENKSAKLSQRLSCLSVEYQRSLAAMNRSSLSSAIGATPTHPSEETPRGDVYESSLAETLDACSKIPSEVAQFITSFTNVENCFKAVSTSPSGFYENYGEYISFLEMMIDIKEKLEVEKSQALQFVQSANRYLAHQYHLLQLMQGPSQTKPLGFNESLIHDCLFTLSLLVFSTHEEAEDEVEIWKRMASSGLTATLAALYGTDLLVGTKTKILILLQYFFDAQNDEPKKKALQIFGLEHAPIIARIISYGTSGIMGESLMELYLQIVGSIFRNDLAANLLHFGNPGFDTVLKSYPKDLLALLDESTPGSAVTKCIFGILYSMLDISELYLVLNDCGVFKKALERVYSGLVLVENEVKLLVKAYKKRIIPVNMLKPVLITALFVHNSVGASEKCHPYTRTIVDYLVEHLPEVVTSTLTTIDPALQSSNFREMSEVQKQKLIKEATQHFVSEKVNPKQIISNYKSQTYENILPGKKFGFFISPVRTNNSSFYHLSMGSIPAQQLSNAFPIEPPAKNARQLSIKITRTQSLPAIQEKPAKAVPSTRLALQPIAPPEFDPISTKTNVLKKLKSLSFLSLAKRLFTPRLSNRRAIATV